VRLIETALSSVALVVAARRFKAETGLFVLVGAIDILEVIMLAADRRGTASGIRR
jgi:hypothetical protein